MYEPDSPAYPNTDKIPHGCEGLTKREYIATALLAGLLSNSTGLQENELQEASSAAMSATLKLEKQLKAVK